MQIGLALPQMGPLAQLDRIGEFAKTVEDLGYDSLWAQDRILTPLKPEPIYPGCTPEQPWPIEQGRIADPLVTLTLAASATSRVRLSTSTLNAVWHHPLVLGRALTSIDLLSHGRLDAGFGMGWMRTEFAALDVPWSARGQRLEEIIEVLRTMWRTNPIEHHGKLWDIPPSVLDLRPVQPGGPPVLLASFNPRGMERIGRIADGWLPAVSTDGPVFEFLDQLWPVATKAAESSGRDPGALRRDLRINTAGGNSPEVAVDVARTARDAGYDGAFLDITYMATGIDDALDIADRVISLYRQG